MFVLALSSLSVLAYQFREAVRFDCIDCVKITTMGFDANTAEMISVMLYVELRKKLPDFKSYHCNSQVNFDEVLLALKEESPFETKGKVSATCAIQR